MNLKANVQILFKIAQQFLRKASFNFHIYIYDSGPRSRNDLDLEYLHTFISSISCLHLPTFRSEAAILSDKSAVFTFCQQKPLVTKFDLVVK